METNGTDTLWYYYDASGSLTGFELNGTAYFYVKNLQGDIIAIVNSSGTKVVEYVYDSWGKLISTTGSLASTVGVKNPYRYRGYRYDTETGLYYLQSRYYDPLAKRFVNADGYASTGQGVLGHNMFAYCGNNPVNYIDPRGYSYDYSGDPAYEWAWDLGRWLRDYLQEKHYSRNELNSTANDIDEILDTYEKQSEFADSYHENTTGAQGEEAIYNDKYLSPNGGHYEIIICSPPDKEPYIVDESIDPLNMGTYNYASNDSFVLIYYLDHFFRDMVPYYIFGNTRAE